MKHYSLLPCVILCIMMLLATPIRAAQSQAQAKNESKKSFFTRTRIVMGVATAALLAVIVCRSHGSASSAGTPDVGLLPPSPQPHSPRAPYVQRSPRSFSPFFSSASADQPRSGKSSSQDLPDVAQEAQPLLEAIAVSSSLSLALTKRAEELSRMEVRMEGYEEVLDNLTAMKAKSSPLREAPAQSSDGTLTLMPREQSLQVYHAMKNVEIHEGTVPAESEVKQEVAHAGSTTSVVTEGTLVRPANGEWEWTSNYPSTELNFSAEKLQDLCTDDRICIARIISRASNMYHRPGDALLIPMHERDSFELTHGPVCRDPRTNRATTYVDKFVVEISLKDFPSIKAELLITIKSWYSFQHQAKCIAYKKLHDGTTIPYMAATYIYKSSCCLLSQDELLAPEITSGSGDKLALTGGA